MNVLAFISQKGGAGKTTLALHVAVEAASRGIRTLIMDLDPQASAASWADRRTGQAVDVDVSCEHPARLDVSLAVAAREGFQLVVLDTAPNADQAALRAAQVADLVLVPCRPSMLDLHAIRTTLNLCDLASRQAMVVLNAAPIRSRVVEEAIETLGRRAQVAETIIHERVAFRHALTDGRVASEYDPDCAAAREVSELFDVMARMRTSAHATWRASDHANMGNR